MKFNSDHMGDSDAVSVQSEGVSIASRSSLRQAQMLTSPSMVASIMDRPLPDFVKGREPRQKPIQGLTYAKEWNTVDFLGKYHMHNFANQSYPTPGSTILEEMTHHKKKNDDLERFDKELAERASRRRNRLHVRTENALFQTKIALGTMIGKPLEEAEDVLRAKQTIVDNKPRFPDTRKEIARFFKNVVSGNHNYIVYAATLGFKSFNFQDEQTGDSALQLAVRAGNVVMVQELLKYTADPNLRNNLGDTAIHDAWCCWHPVVKVGRTKEMRLADEQRTHDIILAILSYGGFVDSVNQRGETALHIACRMGTMQIVTTLLGFQANVHMRDKDGKTASDVALENNRKEVSKLFNIWEAIRHRFVHMDFLVLWKAFLKDYEAVITTNKSADDILFDLTMIEAVARVDREMRAMLKGDVTIDDTLLRQTYKKMRDSDAAAPKPWHASWPHFVEQCNEKGFFSLLDDDQMEALSHHHVDRKKEKDMRTHADSDAGLTRAQLANKKLPDRVIPTPRPRTRQDARLDSRQGSRQRSRQGSRGSSRSPSPSRSSVKGSMVDGGTGPSTGTGDSRPTAGSIAMIPLDLVQGGSVSPIRSVSFLSPVSTSSQALTTTSTLSSAAIAVLPPITSNAPYTDEPVAPLAPPEIPRPMSAIQMRHDRAAKIVALDAKFFRFTRRPATASAMFISLRTPTAPLEGTPEEKSIMRHITSQGKEYELVEKNRKIDLRARLGFDVKEPPRSAMGDYTDGIKVEISGERDKLYNKLNVKPMSDREAVEEAVLAAAEELRKTGKGAKEAAIQEKVALVQDKRLRFIEDGVIPPERKLTLVERMAIERKAAAEEERKKRLGINGGKADTAKAELAAALLAPVDEEVHEEDILPGGGIIDELARKRRERDKRKKKARGAHLLMRSPIKYGVGRLLSTHNLTGAIEAPWATVTGRHKIKAGDRTG